MSTQYTKFINGLDIDKPDWFIIYANQQELIDCVRSCTNGKNGTVAAKNTLRREVSERLFGVVRAAYVGGMVELLTTHVEQV